ncbi:MAG: restriction endonuclease subunit S [Acidithiobacillus ferrooxidans]|nr:restriction endonuclease subunit S [Acidithiobacillus ferrooxidans]MDD5379552.1 restriction endonuclease subunit S [Acidithiobacillus sp.]MDD5576317.1 restriction endonuclease subunit S [Acidithiobacillus sp.]
MTEKLPSGWKVEKLGDVVDILDSKRVPINSKERETRHGPIPYYGATGQVGWIDDFLFDEELVLLGEDGAPFFDSAKQKAYVIRGKSWVNNHAHVLRAKNGIPNAYIKYYLDIVDYHGFVTGTTRHKLNQAAMRQIPIPVAPSDQQKRIVAEIEKQFSRLDETVANLKRVKANLKRYKAAVLKAAASGRLVETEAERARREGRGFETGAQLLQRILETRRSQWQGKGKYKEPAAPDTTDLPELPEGWVWATLPQLGELNRGKSKHRPRDDERLYGGPYPFIQTGDVRKSDGAITGYSQTYSEFGLQQSRLWPVGTLCITIAANIAETGILKFSACFPDSVVGFLIEDGATTTQYVNFFIRTAREKLERLAPATAQKNINLEVLGAVAVPLPPLAEQHRIVAEVDRRLTLLRATEAQVNANLQRAERLRQSILAQAFSGRLKLSEKSVGGVV